jgi:F0F1-type ATP synthase assembly protein I
LDLWQFAGLGLELVTSIGVCGVAGYLLDRWLPTRPFLLITGCLLGMAVGMWTVVRRVEGQSSRSRDDEAR